MTQYCWACGRFRLLSTLSYLCGTCVDAWISRKAAEAQEAT